MAAQNRESETARSYTEPWGCGMLGGLGFWKGGEVSSLQIHPGPRTARLGPWVCSAKKVPLVEKGTPCLKRHPADSSAHGHRPGRSVSRTFLRKLGQCDRKLGQLAGSEDRTGKNRQTSPKVMRLKREAESERESKIK